MALDELGVLHVLGGAAVDGQEATEGLGFFVERIEAAFSVSAEPNGRKHNTGEARLGDMVRRISLIPASTSVRGTRETALSLGLTLSHSSATQQL